MPLEEYRRKRDFAKTPEPAPGSTGVGRERGRPARPPPVRRPAASRDPAPLRLPARDRRRPRVVGRPQGPDPRPVDPADGRPRRGPPDGVLRLRGRDPGEAVRRGRRDRVGLGHLGARGGDARPGRRGRERRAQVRALGREGHGPLHARPHQPAAGHGAPDRVRGRRRRAVAADPQAGRRQRARLGRRGPPAERQVRPDQRRGQGQRAGDLGVGDARGDGRDRPVGGPRGADAALPRADEGDADHPRLPRRGLAVRGQVGRLPRRGGRARRQGRAVHPQRPRRRDVLPAAADPADVDRGARGDRRRRGRGARRSRPPGLLAAPGADQRGADGQARAARLPGVRPPVPRRPLARRRAPRVAQAAARARDPAQLAGPARATHRHRGRRVLRGGQGPGPRGDRGQAPPVPLRAGPPLVVVAQDQGPAGAGAGGRRLDAGGGEREGPGRGRRRGVRGRATAVRGQGRLGVRRADAHASSGACSRRSRPTARPSTRRRRPTIAAAGAATSRACAGSGRSS